MNESAVHWAEGRRIMLWAQSRESGVPEGKAEVIQLLVLLFLLLPPRSHPTILDVPNRLYYEGELQACADVVDRERFCRWEGLPRQVKGSHPVPQFPSH